MIKAGKEWCALWYCEGTMWTKNPSTWAIEQMIQLADHLQARVRGDEGETYETTENVYFHPDDIILQEVAMAASEALLAEDAKLERRVMFGIYAFFIVIGVIGFLIAKHFEQ